MRYLILSDLHVGSNYGLCPKERIHNAFQDWAFEIYSNIVDQYKQSIDEIVLLGDMVDGYGHKDSTTLWTTDINLQIKSAVELISMFITRKIPIKGVTGSGYHYGKGSGNDADRAVTETLGGIHNRKAFYISTPHGVIVFQHKSRNSRTEINVIRTRNGETNGEKISTLIGGHLHRALIQEEGSVKIVHCPCFEYPTEFMGTIGMPVDIGVTILDTNSTGIFPFHVRFSIPFEIDAEMLGYEELKNERIIESERKRIEQLAILSKCSINTVSRILKHEEKYQNPPVLELKSVQVKKYKDTYNLPDAMP